MAKYVVRELSSNKPGHLGNAQCKSHYMKKVLEAKKQEVAGTKYILTLRVGNGCDETKAICTNFELSLVEARVKKLGWSKFVEDLSLTPVTFAAIFCQNLQLLFAFSRNNPKPSPCLYHIQNKI